MNSVKVSPKFQVVIPKELRSRFSISAGDSLRMIPLHGRIEVVPAKKITELRGIARGIDTNVPRDSSDRV